MRIVDLVFGVAWVAFWVYWLASSFGVKKGQSRIGQFAAIRVVIIGVVIVLFRFGARKRDIVVHSPWLGGVGLALLFLGLGLAVWARLYLGRNWGMPMTRKDDPELITSGPYRRVRHPIYSGLILALIGTAVGVSVYWLIAVVFAAGYFGYSAVMEERFMTSRFPAAYPEYQRTSKMLVPFIW